VKTATVTFTEHVFTKSHYQCPYCKTFFETTGDIGHIIAMECSRCGKSIKFQHVKKATEGRWGMKQILIKLCSDCPNYDTEAGWCRNIIGNPSVEKGEIHRDCPLGDYLTKDEAVTRVTVGLICTGRNQDDARGIAEAIVEFLGFKEDL